MNRFRPAVILLLPLFLFSCEKDPDIGPAGEFAVTVSLPQRAGKAAWTQTDVIRLYSQNGSGTPPAALLSPEGEGASVTFSAPAVAEGSDYWLFYPKSAAVSASSQCLYAVIPPVQHPSVSGVDPDAFLAAGDTKSRTGSVSLQALTAWFKFSLRGEGVEAVRRITLSADGVLAGDVKVTGFGSTIAAVADDSRKISGKHDSVSMDGSFQNGGTYGFSVLPGQAKAFKLALEDQEGRVQRFELTGSLSAGSAFDMGTVQVGPFGGSTPFEASFTATREGIRPYVVVFLADGFTEAERVRYRQAAESALDFLFSVQPFKEFKEYFSAYIGWKAASESGPGKTWGTAVSGGMMRSYGQAGRDAIYDWVGAQCPEVKSGKTSLDNVGVFMLVNNTEYIRPVCDWESSGRFVTPVGLTPNWSSSLSLWSYGGTWGNYEWRNGQRYTLTADELTALGYETFGTTRAVSGDFRNELLHEGMGHGFTRLMDEYWYGDKVFPDCTYKNLESYYHELKIPTGWNISASAVDTPWKELDALRDDLMEADARYGRIGTYEGGLAEVLRGVWRSEQVSVMMDDRPYFSTWQRALVYQRLMHVSGEDVDCDVRKPEDLQKYLAIDRRIGGIADPKRDK